MDVTKIFMKKILEETIKEYSEIVFPLEVKIDIEVEEKETFLEKAKQSSLIQRQIQLGFYKDFDKEYPNFLAVYQSGKSPIRKLLGLPYIITVCLDIAKKRLKPYSKKEVTEFLKHAFAHEITHLVEEDLKRKRPELWERALKEGGNNEEYAHEMLAEMIAEQIGDQKVYEKINEELWSLIFRRIQRIRKNNK